MTENERLRAENEQLRRDNDVLREYYWREPQCHPVTFGWWIRLDAYEIANLRAAIEAAGYPQGAPDTAPLHDNPLSALNNGDWIGQIYNKLPDVFLFAKQRPNMTAAQLVESARTRR